MKQRMRDDQEFEAVLGPLVMACQSCSPWRVAMNGGGNPFQLVVAYAGLAFFLTAPAPMLGERFGYRAPVWEQPVWAVAFGAWFLMCALGLAWLDYRWHKSARLALHERGIRYQRLAIPFSEVQAIRAGQPPTVLERWFPTVSSLART